MRVVVVAELAPGGGAGGIEQAVIGLVHGLSHLTDGQEEYVFTVRSSAHDWLQPYLGPRGRIVVRKRGIAGRIVAAARFRAGAAYGRGASALGLTAMPGLEFPLTRSDGFYEALSPTVMHFPYQHMTLTRIASVFSPFDLQHLHLPEYFTSREIRRREFYYRAWCNHARVVETASRWACNDLVKHYNLPPKRVQTIMRGAPASLYSADDRAIATVRAMFQLPEEFCLYPAQTWPHKNHIRLLEAMARNRDRYGERHHLVCTGTKNALWPTIVRRIEELGLENSVQFLGFVSSTQLRALYALAQFMIFPTLFEGAGLPILEALSAGTPVACSNVTALPEYVGDAGLLFDPTSVDSIGDALRRMRKDQHLRATLREKGLAQARTFTWDRTARHCRAVYRAIGGQELNEEDRSLLASGEAG